MSHLVSILIPAYNVEKWVEETINSALGQTWPHKEIIIVDDGSSDSTLAIAKRFESGQVKVISQENMGASTARNRAFENAQGDYIQWLDADDLLAPDKISEQMIAVSLDEDEMILYSGPHGMFYVRTERAKFLPNPLWQDLTPVEWMVYKLNDGYWMNPAGWLVSRKLTEKTGPWDTTLCRDIDGEYFCRVVRASKKVKFVPEAKCYYREWGFGQVSRRATEEAYRSLIKAGTLCVRYLVSLEDSERTRNACLRFLQRRYGNLYPDVPELYEDFQRCASQLGGQLVEPYVGWKLEIMRRLFGWKRAKRLVTIGRRLRLAAAIKLDEMSFRSEGSSSALKG